MRDIETHRDRLWQMADPLFPFHAVWCSPLLCSIPSVPGPRLSEERQRGSLGWDRQRETEMRGTKKLQVAPYFGRDDKHERRLCSGTFALAWKGVCCVWEVTCVAWRFEQKASGVLQALTHTPIYTQMSTNLLFTHVVTDRVIEETNCFATLQSDGSLSSDRTDRIVCESEYTSYFLWWQEAFEWCAQRGAYRAAFASLTAVQ